MTAAEPSFRMLTVALCGDVMTGRGVDQILPHPSDPTLHEGYVKSALGYVMLAERANGPIPRSVQWDYVWGDTLETLREANPDAFVVNLETTITRSDTFDPKGINYRMYPENALVLTAADVDCCALANNHILDWGPGGLEDTLLALSKIGVKTAGAGLIHADATAPAIIDAQGGGRILVFSCCAPTSGVPPAWAAGADKPGVNFLPDLSGRELTSIAHEVGQAKQPEDIAVASIHWGGNWGYEIPSEQRRFAHALIEEAKIDIVHGHSSHHPKAVEIHKGRPILYGCGDFINDYEGISGREYYRDDLVLLYILKMDTRNGGVREFDLAPFRIRKFRLNRLSGDDFDWLHRRLRREYQRFDVDVYQTDAKGLRLSWTP